ncbi:sugar ABC transporter substrate-binding protein [Poseidonocella sedimentorum]|uniref:Monosaccharide ABC transporter substrate-binding protein, CUT2 family n=1 Tax=Poseidonocella sedimentorum TaxID=871652 RepID=A0A1I6E398_9RHOB|nr:sugar ABC transporter substrate-binding protein [Poseidonocella sedimentorum]SFR12254.1 monosaccharide ABC transporter substrate-binding protein, CUT2 family [Poseidonocella sedimentorum]
MTKYHLTSAARLGLGTALATACLTGAAWAEADLEAARAIVEAHSVLPSFEAPGAPFDAASCMAGKRILSIPTSSAIPFVSGIEEGMVAAAEEVGFEVRTWQNQGQPTQWVQGIEYAISNGYDAVDLMAGIDPNALAPQVAAAKDAGLKVFASHHRDVTDETAEPNVDVSLPLSFSRVGEIIAAWIVTKTEGDANVLVIGSDDVPPSQPYWKSFEAKLAELCPDCKATYYNVPVAEWATKIQTTTQSALLQDPSINYLFPIYDSMSQFMLPARAITGRMDLPIASFNGTPFIIDMIRNGDVEMDVGESLGWIARSSLDAYMRDLCEVGDVPDELYIPFYIFDAANAETAGVPAELDKGYGDAHVGGFRALWGLE